MVLKAACRRGEEGSLKHLPCWALGDRAGTWEAKRGGGGGKCLQLVTLAEVTISDQSIS